MDGICKTSFNLKQHWCDATNAEGYRALAKHTFTEVRPDVAHQLHNSFFADDDGGGGANVDHIKYSIADEDDVWNDDQGFGDDDDEG